MEKSRAIELLKLAVPIKALTQKEYSDFVEAVNMGMDALEQPTTSDTISRQQAIRWVKTECNPYGKPTIDFESGKKVIEHLEQMPPAQPEPKEGEWVDGRCNKCGGHAPFWAMASTYYKSDFCPHCGADMRGEKDE